MSGRRTIAAVIGAAAAVGIASGVAWAAFSSTTTNGPNTFSAKTDLRPPVAGATIGARAAGGGTAGQIRQGVGYYIYANISDVGNPASGVQTVTANLSTFDTGVTAAALTTTGGPWTVGGTSYTRRSALLTANTPLTTGATYSYSLTMTDVAGNSTTSSGFTVTIETYSTVINATSGLVSYWRFGESTSTVSSDTFTGTGGVLLQNYAGEVGAAWTRHNATTNALLSSENRLRRESAGGTQYYASGAPASADYSVQAKVHVKSVLNQDAAAVIGRVDTSAVTDTYYLARYVNNGLTKQWELMKVVAGAATSLGTYAQTLTVGATYTLTLDLHGSTIRLLVDGTQRVSATDSAITAAGRGGVRLGFGGAADVPSNLTGLHLDDFTLTAAPPASDGRGTNHGTYVNGVVLGSAGALAGDSNTAAQLDGVNDYVTIPDAASLDLGDGPFTLETWIKRSNQDTGGLSLFQKGAGGYQFGLYLNKLFFAKDNVATFAESTTTVDTNWHHVVATKSGSTFKVYIDGVDRTFTLANQTLVNTASALVLGAKAGTSEFLGAIIDEAAIYNTVLSAATVADHYQSGKGS